MRTFYTILFFVFSAPFGIGQTAIDISNNTENIPIEKFALVFKTIEDDIDILSVPIDKWEKPKQQGLNFGMVRDIHWVKVPIYNSTKQPITLHFYTPYHHIESLHIYQKTKNKLELLLATGTTTSYNQKPKYTPGYAFPLHFPSGKTELYLKMRHINMPLRANSYLVKEKKMDRIVQQSNANYSVWRVIMFIAFLISLVAYLMTRFKIFLYYLMMNIGIILFIGMETGLYFLVFDKENWLSIIDIKHLGDILVLYFFPLFLNELTPIKKHNPKLWRFSMLLWVVAPITWCIGLLPELKETAFFFYSVWFLIYLTIYIFIVQLFFLFFTFLKKEKNSLILFCLYIVYIGAVTLEVILPNLGMKSDSIYVYDVLLKSSIIEVILFLVLIGREMYSLFKDRNTLLSQQKKLKEDMLHAVIKSQEEERNVLGRELHDMIGANMSVVRQNAPKENPNLIKIIDETINSVRSLSHGLMTPRVKGEQLKNEIIDLCLSATTANFQAKYYFHKWQPILNEEDSTHLYRIIQELLHNAVKHSQATHVFIQIIIRNGKLKLSFEDNGVGFDVEKEKKGKGLLGITHRAEILKASLQIESSSSGTLVEMEITRDEFKSGSN